MRSEVSLERYERLTDIHKLALLCFRAIWM